MMGVLKIRRLIMLDALLKALSFVFIIVLGYVLKKGKLFGPNDYQVVSKIVTKITLPATVIVSFSDANFDLSMITITLLSIGINVLMLLLGFLISRKKDLPLRALHALALPGYNIGAFAMPFTQSILGPGGAAITCLFDTGNAIMCTGGSYAATYSVLHKGEEGGLRLGALLKQLLRVLPFVTYLTMLALTLLNLHLPARLVDFIRPIANANPYCAMFLMGLLFELNFPKQTIQAVWRIVLIRNMVAVLLALGFWFLLPAPLIIRQTLAVLVFAPGSIMTPAFVEQCGGDASAASCAGSLCTITSIIGMIVVLLATGV